MQGFIEVGLVCASSKHRRTLKNQNHVVEVDGSFGILSLAEAEVMEDLLDLQWIELKKRGAGLHESVQEGEGGEEYHEEGQEDGEVLGKRELWKEKKFDNGIGMQEMTRSMLGRQI